MKCNKCGQDVMRKKTLAGFRCLKCRRLTFVKISEARVNMRCEKCGKPDGMLMPCGTRFRTATFRIRGIGPLCLNNFSFPTM